MQALIDEMFGMPGVSPAGNIYGMHSIEGIHILDQGSRWWRPMRYEDFMKWNAAEMRFVADQLEKAHPYINQAKDGSIAIYCSSDEELHRALDFATPRNDNGTD